MCNLLVEHKLQTRQSYGIDSKHDEVDGRAINMQVDLTRLGKAYNLLIKLIFPNSNETQGQVTNIKIIQKQVVL